MSEKPAFTVAGPEEGEPTFDDLRALFRKLTGRDPDPDDEAEARAEYDAVVAGSDAAARAAGPAVTRAVGDDPSYPDGTTDYDEDEDYWDDDPADAADLDPSHAELRRMQALAAQILQTHGAAALAEIGVGQSFNADVPELREWLRTKNIEFASQVTNTTKERLRRQLLEGLRQGETYPELAARVRTVFNGRKANALAVARTETVGAANKGRMAAYEDAGVEEHEWVTQRDGEVRASHQSLDGQVRPIGEPFSNGLEFPGDTAHGEPADFVNCRCDVLAVVPGGSRPGERSAPVVDRDGLRDAQWRAFAQRTRVEERAVANQFARVLAVQEARVLAALRRVAGV